MRGGGHRFGPPESEAGHRTVVIPGIIVDDDLSWDLTRFVGPDDDAPYCVPGLEPGTSSLSGKPRASVITLDLVSEQGLIIHGCPS